MKNELIVAGLKGGLKYLAMSREEETRNYNKDTWICLAISLAEDRYEITTEAYLESTDLIRQRLGEFGDVKSYLYSLDIPDQQLTDKNVQRFRKRWLNALIKEFS